MIRKYCTLKNELIKKTLAGYQGTVKFGMAVYLSLKVEWGRILTWATLLITLLIYLVDLLLQKNELHKKDHLTKFFQIKLRIHIIFHNFAIEHFSK